jgi:hypothetical protein
LDARAANDRIAEKAEQLRFHSRVPMMCECSDPDCRRLVLIWGDHYRQLRQDPRNVLTASGHDGDQTDLVKETADYDIRRASRTRDDGSRHFA